MYTKKNNCHSNFFLYRISYDWLLRKRFTRIKSSFVNVNKRSIKVECQIILTSNNDVIFNKVVPFYFKEIIAAFFCCYHFLRKRILLFSEWPLELAWNIWLVYMWYFICWNTEWLRYVAYGLVLLRTIAAFRSKYSFTNSVFRQCYCVWWKSYRYYNNKKLVLIFVRGVRKVYKLIGDRTPTNSSRNITLSMRFWWIVYEMITENIFPIPISSLIIWRKTEKLTPRLIERKRKTKMKRGMILDMSFW